MFHLNPPGSFLYNTQIHKSVFIKTLENQKPHYTKSYELYIPALCYMIYLLRNNFSKSKSIFFSFYETNLTLPTQSTVFFVLSLIKAHIFISFNNQLESQKHSWTLSLSRSSPQRKFFERIFELMWSHSHTAHTEHIQHIHITWLPCCFQLP